MVRLQLRVVCFAALTVKYITRRFIMEYDPTLGECACVGGVCECVWGWVGVRSVGCECGCGCGCVGGCWGWLG